MTWRDLDLDYSFDGPCIFCEVEDLTLNADNNLINHPSDIYVYIICDSCASSGETFEIPASCCDKAVFELTFEKAKAQYRTLQKKLGLIQ